MQYSILRASQITNRPLIVIDVSIPVPSLLPLQELTRNPIILRVVGIRYALSLGLEAFDEGIADE